MGSFFITSTIIFPFQRRSTKARSRFVCHRRHINLTIDGVFVTSTSKNPLQNHDLRSCKFKGSGSHQSVAKHRHSCKSIKDFSRFNTFHEYPAFMEWLISELMHTENIRRHGRQHIIFNYGTKKHKICCREGKRVTDALLSPALCLFLKIIHKFNNPDINVS
jgi:hypothetical protein